MPVQEASRPERPGLPGSLKGAGSQRHRLADRQTDRQEKLDSWGHSLSRLSGPLSLPLHPLLPADLTVSVPDVASGFLSVHWPPVGQ